MYHLDNTSGVPEMPEPKEQQSNTPRWFGESQEQGGISWPGADWFNTVQAELLNLIHAAGLTPDKKSFDQLSKAIPVLGDAGLREDLGSRDEGKGGYLLSLMQGGSVQDAVRYITPEMYRNLVVDGDWSPAIIAACTAARELGLNRVVGDGEYIITRPIPCVSGVMSVGGGSPLYGFSLELNRVIISDKWDPLPEEWWNATPAFYSAGNTQSSSASTEHFRLKVNEFYGQFRAHFCESKGGGFSTSYINPGTSRDHIIVFKNIENVTGQSTMNIIRGYLWQTGYLATLIGGKLNGAGSGNAECHDIKVLWLATQRFGGHILCDGARFTTIGRGTYDYNGKNSSLLTLTGLSTGDAVSNESANRWVFEFGSPVLSVDEMVSSTALGQLIYHEGEWKLLVTEDTDITVSGASKWSVGTTIKNASGTFTATITGIKLPSAASNKASYMDIYMCQRLGGFAMCKIDANYVGGYFCHFDFSNDIWAPHAVQGRTRASYRGLQVAGSYNHLQLHASQMSYRSTPFMDINEDGILLNQPLTLEGRRLNGVRYSNTLEVGVPTRIMTFTPGTNSVPRGHLLQVYSSVTSMSGLLIVTVYADSIVVKNVGTQNITITTNGLSMYFTLIGSPANIYVNALRGN